MHAVWVLTVLLATCTSCFLRTVQFGSQQYYFLHSFFVHYSLRFDSATFYIHFLLSSTEDFNFQHYFVLYAYFQSGVQFVSCSTTYYMRLRPAK